MYPTLTSTCQNLQTASASCPQPADPGVLLPIITPLPIQLRQPPSLPTTPHFYPLILPSSSRTHYHYQLQTPTTNLHPFPPLPHTEPYHKYAEHPAPISTTSGFTLLRSLLSFPYLMHPSKTRPQPSFPEGKYHIYVQSLRLS